MDMMSIRRAALLGSVEKGEIAYEAFNLSFDGTSSTVINTGIYLFTAENINRDFEFIAEDIQGKTNSTNTIICAKHNGNSYGFLVRIYDNTATTYNGSIFMKADVSGTVIVRRINGQISLSGKNIRNPDVQFVNAVFDWPLVLGCAIDDDGTYYRYKSGTIGHVRLKWL